jgi:hypothetical protein
LEEDARAAEEAAQAEADAVSAETSVDQPNEVAASGTEALEEGQ